MKMIDVYGIGSSFVDIYHEISEEDLDELGIRKSDVYICTDDEPADLVSKLGISTDQFLGGGCAANSMTALAHLGASVAYGGLVAHDRFGNFFLDQFMQLGVRFDPTLQREGVNGHSIIMLTPDRERTIYAVPGITANFGAQHLSEGFIAQSEWLFIEGQIFKYGSFSLEEFLPYLMLAKEKETKIALSLGDVSVVKDCGSIYSDLLPYCDLVIVGEDGACEFTGADSGIDACSKLEEAVPMAVVTLGSEGAVAKTNGTLARATTEPCAPVDTTGAGDAFAGGFLYGLTHDYSIDDSLSGACAVAREVVLQMGARIQDKLSFSC